MSSNELISFVMLLLIFYFFVGARQAHAEK